MKPLLVQFGAGNIGRSLMGDVFSDAGYRICFVDVNQALIDDLNVRGRYEITYRDGNCADRKRWVEDVQAINVADNLALHAAVLEADLLGVSVGKAALESVAIQIANSLKPRFRRLNRGIDLIIAENLAQPAPHLRAIFAPHFDGAFPDEAFGLVATCIGRMVPVQASGYGPLSDVVAESATDFFGDLNAFRYAAPRAPGISLVAEIDAYVDRKLFLHNMTHSAIAYLAAQQYVDVRIVGVPVIDGDPVETSV